MKAASLAAWDPSGFIPSPAHLVGLGQFLRASGAVMIFIHFDRPIGPPGQGLGPHSSHRQRPSMMTVPSVVRWRVRRPTSHSHAGLLAAGKTG